MKKTKHLIAAGLGLCIGTTAGLFWKFRKRIFELIRPEAPETTEDAFLREWTAALTEDARTFNGLYNGLLRVQKGNAKKPEKVLREWSQRAHYRWEDQPVDKLCQEIFLPLIESPDAQAITKWVGLLLEAAAAAGITKEENSTLVLTEANTNDYLEWDGSDLYPGDEIEIITPAWYQQGRLLEQGQCRKRNGEEE